MRVKCFYLINDAADATVFMVSRMDNVPVAMIVGPMDIRILNHSLSEEEQLAGIKAVEYMRHDRDDWSDFEMEVA